MNLFNSGTLLTDLFRRRMSPEAAAEKYRNLSAEETEFFLLNLQHCSAHGDWEGDFELYQQYKAELGAYFSKEMEFKAPALMHSIEVIAKPNCDPLFAESTLNDDGTRTYREAIVTDRNGSSIQICTNPYIPFVEVRSAGSHGYRLQTSVSGGYFHAVPLHAPQMRRDGTKSRLFKRWGTCGATADGTINASVEVPHWVIDDRERTLGFY